MMKKLIFAVLCMALISPCVSCQNTGKKSGLKVEGDDSIQETISTTDSLSILVAGDLMQHMPQINAAYNSSTGKYDYTACFELVKPIVSAADLAIANFEVTMGGKPYKGYPCFSAPDEYLDGIIGAGFDVLTTGNNHCLDSRQRGLERTIDMMDAKKVPHLGTYKNAQEREKQYPLLVEKNGFRIVLLNFTYATNGLRVQQPNVVNYIDTVQIAADIQKAKGMNPDLIIAIPHWGIEYSLLPNKPDKDLADWLFKQGVDHIIGGHPHVLQPMERRNAQAAIERQQQTAAQHESQYQEQMAQATSDYQKELKERLEKFLKEYNKDGRYAMILSNSAATMTVMYASNGLDITADVIAGLNKQYKPEEKAAEKK